MKSAIAIFLCAVLLAGCVKNEPPSHLAVVGLAGGDTALVAVGDNFAATFMIKNARNVYAVAALVKYDTTYLAVAPAAGQIASKGQFLGATGDLTSSFVNGIPGGIVFAYSKQGEQPGSIGEGDLWRLSMTALRPGLTKISFESSRCFVMSPNIVGNDLERLPARFDDKFVKIEPETVPPDTTTVPPDTVAVIFILIK